MTPARTTVRTSLTDPLLIAEVAAAGGVIGMTICPGRKGPGARGGAWDRDPALDMAVVAAWRPGAVVTLMETPEFAQYGVAGLARAMAGLDARWFHLPIRDVDVPDAAFEVRWGDAGSALRAMLRSGGRVLVHCVGGLGRTGLVAARLLVELGTDPGQAVAAVRGARPGAIETAPQLRHVLACRAVAENLSPGRA